MIYIYQVSAAFWLGWAVFNGYDMVKGHHPRFSAFMVGFSIMTAFWLAIEGF